MWDCHTQRQYEDWQCPLAKFVFEKKTTKTNKKQKKRKLNWGYIWGYHSFKRRPSLVKPPSNVSPETKDCRVVQYEYWVSQLNIRTELGLNLALSHPKTMSELRNPPCTKATSKGKKLFFQKKEHIWCFEISSFNFKDNFIITREPLVCGNIFDNYPIVSIVQIAWMVDCSQQRVVVQERNFVVVSDSDRKKVFRKALEKLVIFDNLITFNTRVLGIGHQDGSRLNNRGIIDGFLTGITW